LDDGTPVFAFARASYSRRGHGSDATAAGLAESLRPEVIDQLIRNEGAMIIYTHLGKNDGPPFLPPKTVASLRNLARVHQEGDVLVTTSSRLLNYVVNRDYLNYEVVTSGDGLEIKIRTISDPVRGTFVPRLEQLQGLSFYVIDSTRVTLTIDGQPIPDVVSNPPDETGYPSISIPWRRLEPLDAAMRDYKAQGIF
jgi:hypothetical protein